MKKENKAAFRFILSYLSRYRLPVLLVLFCTSITAVLQTLTPWVLGATIDYISAKGVTQALYLPPFISRIIVTEQSTHSTLIRFAALLLTVALFLALFRALSRYIMAKTARHIDTDLRNDYFGHLQKMSQHFFQTHKTGDLMARATNDLRAIERVLGFGILQTYSTLLLFVLALNFMFRINTELTLLALAPLPLVVFIWYNAVSKIHLLYDYIQEQFAMLTTKTQESFSGIRIIKSYVRSNWESKVFKKENEKYIERNLTLARLDAFLDIASDFILGVSAIIIIWYGGRLIMHSKLTIGELVALFNYVMMLAWPMASIGLMMDFWQKALTAAMRVQRIMNHPVEIGDNKLTDHRISRIGGSIEFDHVSFTYPGAIKPALENISFTAQTGEKVAIVGPTGAGKSTLVHLLPRLIEPTTGCIRIGGHNLASIPLRLLRQNISLVQQETFLFSDTLAGNIAFGSHDVDKQLISRAAKVSQLELDLDQFPDGLETEVGERGITLSGGQKQRTAISRAVIRKPTLLIFDDALSAVDTYTEEEILNQIRPIMKDCITIIVAHRISTIRDADIILVLEQGRIVERGTHQELIGKKGLYYQMHERQRLEENLREMN